MSPLIKPAILTFSILLAAGFIYYRIHLAAPVSAAAPQAASPATPQPPRAVLSGSKSGVIAPSTPPPGTILPSSKYAVVAGSPSTHGPAAPPATLPQTVSITVNDPSNGNPVTLNVPLMLIAGSKSAPVFVFTPEQIEKYRVKTPAPPSAPPPQPAALLSSSKVIVLTPDINIPTAVPLTQPATQPSR